jgi:hypothetical protein
MSDSLAKMQHKEQFSLTYLAVNVIKNLLERGATENSIKKDLRF